MVPPDNIRQGKEDCIGADARRPHGRVTGRGISSVAERQPKSCRSEVRVLHPSQDKRHKMEYFNGILCISGSDLIISDRNPDGIVSECNYKHLRTRKRITVVRRGCFETPSLTAVDSLPTKLRNAVYERYPDYKAQAEAKPFIDAIIPDAMAIRFFAEYTLPDGRHLSAERQADYANAAAILNCLRDMLEKANSHRKRQGARRLPMAKFWKDAATALPRVADRWPHSLPENDRRLQDRFRVYIKSGYESLISRKFLNNNAAKVDDEVKESILHELFADARNLDNEQVMALYNILAERLNWKKITRQAIAVWRDKFELVDYAGRRGSNEFKNVKTMQVKRSRPTAPLLYWTMDGWDAELLFQRTSTDKNGHSITTFHHRLTVVAVLDPCLNYPIGYAIGDHECPELIKEALRNAADHTAELFGNRYRSSQLQCDHYAIKAMTPLYSVMAGKLTPARVGNAKAKVVEPYFNRINKKYCQLMPNWSGFGVTSDKQNQPNSESLNKYRHSFPDEQGCREQITRIMELERSSKIDRYKELFAALPEESKLPLSDQQYLMTFGAETGTRNALEGSGLRPTIGGIKRTYDCYDPTFRNYAHLRWTVKYDPKDLTRVLAVNDEGTLQFMLEEKFCQPMALAERKDGDAIELQRVRDFNSLLEAHVTEQRALSGTKTRELFEDHPELDGTLSKLLLVDSRGQHKDNRNKGRSLSRTSVDTKAIECKVVDDIALTDNDDEENLYNLY